jgi:hypothetical protein
MDAKVISEIVAALTERVATVEHSHMLKPWEMVFGGLVLPMLAEADESVKADPRYAELTAKYDRAAIEAFFAEKIVEKVKVERVVEKEVVTKIVGGAGMTRMPTLHQTVEEGGKFRRLKDKVAKIARKVNDIPPDGRDAINQWWNTNQRLTDSGDCQPIADFINRNNPSIQPLSAAQVSGWLSWLCRLALKTEADRTDYIQKSVQRGKFSVVPWFRPNFITEIANNKAKQAEDRRIAAEAKAKMKKEKEDALKSGVVTA